MNISDDFVLNNIPVAPSSYSMAYIYAYCLFVNGEKDLSPARIADLLNMEETQVKKAWLYWASLKAMELDENKNPVNFMTGDEKEQSEKRRYSPSEIESDTLENKDIKQLFVTAEKLLLRPIKYTEMNTLYSINADMGMPCDVLAILLDYCISSNHYSMRYIEKVAEDWIKGGIDNADKAKKRMELYNNGYKKVLNSMGVYGRFVNPSEENYIKKWVEQYGFDVDIVCMACEKAVINTGKPNFPYADTIIENWHVSGLKSKDEIKKSIENYQFNTKSSSTSDNKPKQNKFVNFKQRKWDFDKISKLNDKMLWNENEEK